MLSTSLILTSAAALAAAAAAAASPSAYSALVEPDTRSLDAIYQAARKENGTLQVFWGGDAGSQGDDLRTAWAAQYPDVKLNLTVDLSKYHDNRIDRAYQEGIHVADVAVLQTLQDFPRWKQEGKLLNYKPATFDDILQDQKDLDGAWYACLVYNFGSILYDSTKLNASQVPSSFGDFAKPEWKGKLILTYPNDDDAVASLFALIVGRYGYQWLYDLANNDIQWVRGTGTPGFQLIDSHNTTSKRVLSFTSYANADFLATKLPEAPEQYVSWAQTTGIIKDTPMPESAKLFVSWLTSNERQNATAASGSSSVLTTLNERYGVSPYTSNATQINDFRVFEQDRANVEWWKNLFEEVLGTPQGKSPTVVYPNPSS
ncbi:uncharacterized protein MYCFIDRAFT_134075 [Pseudocercospora fijiensis CIRAD86]|uniref:Periplasmic binding protein-like II n=1 Tax=Pseudocercospora fijiensis (strain CIRAD86) TaxID=383855 RepID=M2Z3C9_PSEFD|nr:uncharacterized protein MYCFIDRAFT_134075 [Pseudocercospora fijiensis CIRAD86]EME84330.1 hypothetical protein MYCFIDRAFT_134075 [Pseudocercospora fijiensis CIRAD86]